MIGLSIARLVDSLLAFYSLLIFAYVILSWFPASGTLGEVRRVLATVCEPYIGLFRRIVPMAKVGGAGLDFSPFVALIVISLVRQYLVPALYRAGL